MDASREQWGSRASAEPRKVLVVVEWHVKYAARLARGFADLGCDVRLLTRTHDLEFGAASGAARAGDMARWVAGTLDGTAQHLALAGRVRDVRAVPGALSLWRTIRRFGPEFTLMQDSVTQDLRLALVAGALPRRYALTVHNVEPHPGDPRRGQRHQSTFSLLIRNAGLMFVHTDSLRERLIELERPRAPVVVVPHGVGRPAPARLVQEPTLLFFGRILRYKGIDTLLDAMTLVWQRVSEARLTIAGHGPIGGHPALADPRVTVRNEYVPEDEIEHLFAAARCVVLPYLEASQSGVGTEAKMFGRPLVVTDAGGLPELVADGSGRVVPAGQARPLADALIEVLASPGLAERMAGRALDFVSHAGWNRVAELSIEAWDRRFALGDRAASSLPTAPVA